MKKLSLLIAMLVVSVSSFAQWTLSGHIQDNNNNPVANHTVDFVSAGNWVLSTMTNSSGNYSINIPTSTPVNTLIDIYTTDSICFVNHTDSVFYTNQMNLVSNFTFCSNTTTNYAVSGQITTGTSGADAAIVYLIQQVYDSNTQITTLTAIDSAAADTQSGYYTMPIPTNYNGVLKVKAALLPISTDYASYLPTYYSSSLTWNGTGVQTISGVMNTTANISLIAGTNPGGPAFIGGDVTQGANKSTAVGDPLAGRIMLLTNAANQAVAYTYSDANGHFSFPSLAYGSYKLFGDALGKTNVVLSFTLDANTPNLPDMDFRENDDEFWGTLWPASVATTPELAAVNVYPNPATDVVNIKGLDAINGAKTVTISSINGAVVFSASYQQNEEVSIPVFQLGSGLYMLQIATEKGSSIYKIAK
ncbi:MAG TPA: T9SS type A sorting domain-containing protein [Flavipsychrobacter sp.]|nr:T9SS type A sorting domain-containing protein [Flavipsychrobacter sp.]